jgi:hypothetical protein
MLQAMPDHCIARMARFPATSLIHPNAWKGPSAEFEQQVFSEVEPPEV